MIFPQIEKDKSNHTRLWNGVGIMSGKFRFRQQGRQQPNLMPVKDQQQPPHQATDPSKDQPISASLEDTVRRFKDILGDNGDFLIRRIHIFGSTPAALFLFTDMTDQSLINPYIMEPLMDVPLHLKDKPIDPARLREVLLHETLIYSECQMETKLTGAITSTLQGRAVLAVEGIAEVFILGCPNLPKRAIEQPPTEQTIQGPREGFIELLHINLGLLRYRLPTPDFRVHVMQIGRYTKSKVALCYVEGIVNPELVKEAKKRLEKIDLDGILDSGYISQLLEDNEFSPFPQIQNTEKPDRAVANLLEGRVVILVDGSPFALIAPAVFSQFWQSTEDYSSRVLQGTFSRFARIIALVFSLITPSLYVAIISFNPELIPTEFAVAVAGGRAGVPFPSVVEVLIMEISMEVLREATIRLPQQVGGALSIVGVLVVGQAAVEAGFASPITVVVIALTTIGSFATPVYNAAFALRMLRFPLILMAGIFGLYGIVVGIILIGNHALSLKSFGAPYFAPQVPFNVQGMKDVLVRSPLWSMRKRPQLLHPLNETRAGPSTKDMKQQFSNVLDPSQLKNQGRSTKSDEVSKGNDGSGSDSDSN